MKSKINKSLQGSSAEFVGEFLRLWEENFAAENGKIIIIGIMDRPENFKGLRSKIIINPDCAKSLEPVSLRMVVAAFICGLQDISENINEARENLLKSLAPIETPSPSTKIH